MHPIELDPSKYPKSALIIWGGSDIHPSYYGRPVNGSHVSGRPSARDETEYQLILRAVELGIPIIGVCRGAQMLCAVAGGRLAQHVTGHGGANHTITDISTGEAYETSSLHHQMMYPYDDDGALLGEIIATCSPRSSQYMDLEPVEIDRICEAEPEVIWFPKQKGLAIQGHPEFMRATHPFNKYVHQLLEKHVFPSE